MATLLLFVVAFLRILSVAKSDSSKPRPDFCPNYARNFATYSKSQAEIPPNPVGRWTSESCEVTPGPKFVLRDIRINRHSTWQLVLHHYKDAWCSSAVFTVVVEGRYNIKGESTSVRGSYNCDFTFDKIVFVAHNTDAMISISRMAASHCPGAGLPLFKKASDIRSSPIGTNITVGKEAIRRRECREALGLHLHSYRIIRKITERGSSKLKDELYFSELPTHRAKKTFSSTTLQLPLKRSESRSCDACRKIMSSTVMSPPVLRTDRRLFDFSGSWVSGICEIQSDLFVTRYLNFDNNQRNRNEKSVWQLQYHYFVDPNCKTLSYVIKARGNFTDYSPSSVIAGASNYIFELTHLKITPMEELIVTFLRAADTGTCGIASNWRLGSEQDVTKTGGCSAFGLKLPSLDYDVIKVIRESNGLRRLFTGQRPTDLSTPDSASKRPTSFGIPLKRCSDVIRGVEPITTSAPTVRRTIRFLKPRFTIPPNVLGRLSTPISNNVKPDDNSRARNLRGIGQKVLINSITLWMLAVISIMYLR